MKGALIALCVLGVLGVAPASGALAQPGQARIIPVEAVVIPVVRETTPLRREVKALKAASSPLKAEKAAVREALRDLKAQRSKNGELKLNISADVLFAFDSAAIRPQAAKALSQVALVIRDKKPGHVRIEGHTDAKGSASYNMRLSRKRAESVFRWLTEREGINARLLETKGLGESRPVAPNVHPDGSDNPEGRRLNRRVEIFIR